ncbi:TetR/AcrR family transcriptional regulator [Oceanimonas baumannii]|uniref:TetR/AcrR family transcriptional regulator n=1 Tax=Oceanimonas baumannii TaxID=129578 RepID=UPI001D192987|nr:TetR/AcrR family transcriptional regulator [Oceanimonas baumannii]MCC4264463.1 TetR/AcrR family transcriptional regulator [Oceanimonas baumannii]
MNSSSKPTTRGRPRTITRERIVDAGINMGLPNITFVGVASALGVSHMALYKHVASLEALRHLVAEEIFHRWQLPSPPGPGGKELQQYLLHFTDEVSIFVKNHPGLAPYLIRRSAATAPMLAKIDAHHNAVAATYGLSKTQTRWLLATITFHCIAVTDAVYSVAGQPGISDTDSQIDEAEMAAELAEGMRALIVGALALLKE